MALVFLTLARLALSNTGIVRKCAQSRRVEQGNHRYLHEGGPA